MTFEEELRYKFSIRMEAKKNTKQFKTKKEQEEALLVLLEKMGIKEELGKQD